MKTNILLRQVTIDEKTRLLIEKKISKLDKFFQDETEVSVTISKVRDKEKLELTISQYGKLFRSEVTAEDVSHAIDTAVSIIERQIRKNKTKLQKRIRDNAFLKGFDETDDTAAETDELKIRRKDFKLEPMSVEDAVLQMDLLEHTFFVFKDVETGNVNVVYKRHGDEYGLIVTED